MIHSSFSPYSSYSNSAATTNVTPDPFFWHYATEAAKKCLVQIKVDSEKIGMGVLLKKDLVLIPKHLISLNSTVCGSNLILLLKKIEIIFNHEFLCQSCVVTSLIEDGGARDYCLLQLAEPVIYAVIPSINYNSPNECLFVQYVDHRIDSTVCSPCTNNKNAFCSSKFSWTQPGSSGGIYLNRFGELIALHLGQANTKCRGQTDQERQILLISDIIKNSPFFCTLDQTFNPLPIIKCLTPLTKNIGIDLQKDYKSSRKKSLFTDEPFIYKFQEIHVRNAERKIRICVEPNMKKKDAVNVRRFFDYEISYIEKKHGKTTEKSNIHNASYPKENVSKFYKIITDLFAKYFNKNERALDPIPFDYGSFNYIAKLTS